MIALFKDDLKALLAFSTVSHLGLVTMLLGFGTTIAAVAAVFHIINHATFKAALFMTAGIVDHETGTRDVKRLGGLRHLMPITFTIGTIAALSMAGLPPLNGFLSKEMMLEETVHTTWLNSPYLVPGLALLAALFSAAYSFRFVSHVFLGPERDDYPAHPHDPPVGLWLAPAFLVVLVVLIGLYSAAIVGPLVAVVSSAVIGGEKLPYYSLKLWHGFTPALYMSVVATLGGLFLLALHKRGDQIWNALPRPEAKVIFEAIIDALTRLSRWITDELHNGVLSRYAIIFVAFVVGLGYYAYTTGTIGVETRVPLEAQVIPIIGWICLVGATLAIMWFHRNRLLSLVLIGVVGLIVSMAFNYLSAPDLALTQISVEVVTMILLLLSLNFLPTDTPWDSSAARRWRDAAISVVAGIGSGALIYALMMRDFAFPTISEFHLANSYKGGGGTNVVNVILVDFRGFDTFGEIIVLGIAALIIYALTEAVLSTNVRSLPAEP